MKVYMALLDDKQVIIKHGQQCELTRRYNVSQYSLARLARWTSMAVDRVLSTQLWSFGWSVCVGG